MGVQFDQPIGYQEIRAGEVWRLFSEAFPKVQEMPPLPPYFETFGPQASMINLTPITGAIHNRFWFVSSSGDELIQFQNDRILHNWRKVNSPNSEYPRFESIIEKFADEIIKLQSYFSSLHQQSLVVRQCEITYVNHIRYPNLADFSVSNWINFLHFTAPEPDDFLVTFRRTIKSHDGKPKGRLTCESATVIEPDGRKFVSLTLTARGIPDEPGAESALEFLKRGRDLIVNAFADVTTDSAHQFWERLE